MIKSWIVSNFMLLYAFLSRDEYFIAHHTSFSDQKLHRPWIKSFISNFSSIIHIIILSSTWIYRLKFAMEFVEYLIHFFFLTTKQEITISESLQKLPWNQITKNCFLCIYEILHVMRCMIFSFKIMSYVFSTFHLFFGSLFLKNLGKWFILKKILVDHHHC